MKNKEIKIVLTIGIVSFLLIEAFSSFVNYVNWVIFQNISNLSYVLPLIGIYLLIIFGIGLVFTSNLIKKNFKLYIQLYIIICLRVLTQFYFTSELFLLFITALFITTLVCLIDLIRLLKESEELNDFRLITGGLMVGIGIQLFFTGLLTSSTLSTDLIKIPFSFSFIALLIYINQTTFNPKNRGTDKELKTVEKTDEIGPLKFLLLGILFYMSMIWIFNPIAIAAYDVVILNLFSFGFLYYIIVMIISVVASCFIAFVIIMKNDKELIKKILLFVNGGYAALNCSTLLFLEADATILSTIYLTILTFMGVFTIIFDISYLFNYYSLPSGIKLCIGFIGFLFGFVFSYAIFLLVSWAIYSSMLITVFTLSIVFFGLFLLLEVIKIEKLRMEKKLDIKINKKIGFILMMILGINIIPLVTSTLTRTYESPSAGNPIIMVWNIHNAGGVDAKFDIDRLIEEIKQYNPDILGLNEVDMGAMKTGFIDIASYMAHKLGMYFYYGPTFIKHYGNAILSKYPFESVENIPLPRSDEVNGEPRGVIKAKFNINSKIWTVYVNHLSTKQQDRLIQVPYIVNKIVEDTSQNVVWMGDFNFVPTSEEYSKINGTATCNFTDTHDILYDPPSLTGGFDENHIPIKIIDYIFCSTDLNPIKGIVHCSVASDHCAVITHF